MVKLLPKCIKKHPWGKRRLTDRSDEYGHLMEKGVLDDLYPEEYDLLIEALSKLLKPKVKDVEKKSEPSSGVKASNLKDGS